MPVASYLSSILANLDGQIDQSNDYRYRSNYLAYGSPILYRHTGQSFLIVICLEIYPIQTSADFRFGSLAVIQHGIRPMAAIGW
jgi:hypothetical protein